MGEPERSKLGFNTVRILRDDLLGKGAYGVVYKARCDRLICAAKELHEIFFRVSDQEEQSSQVSRFQNECALLSQLKHPNVVQYLGTLREPGSRTVVLLMELLDASLHSYIERNKHSSIPFHLEVNFSHDVALALDYLHTNGIQHRDLSCKNILLLGEVRAKVSDFGVSKLSDPTAGYSVQSMCPGTVVYMPPEAILPKPKYSKTFDEFSLGVCMIQLLGRKFPEPTDPFIQHDPGKGMESIQLSIVPEVQRRRGDIDACDQSNPVLPIALSCISNNERDRPCADKICELLSIIKNKVAYKESSRRLPSNGSITDAECGDFVFIELEENVEQQLQVKIKTLHHQLDEKERRVADAQRIVFIREQQLRMNTRLQEDMEAKLTENSRQLAEAKKQITELQREVDRQQIQLKQAREQRNLLSQKSKSLQSMEDRLLENMEVSFHRTEEAQYNSVSRPARSPARSRLASAPSAPHLKIEVSSSSRQHENGFKPHSTATKSSTPSTTPPSSSPSSFSSSLTSSLPHRKISLSWSCGKDSPVEFQPQSSTAVGLGKCVYISHCNYSRTEGFVYRYDFTDDSWLALPVINKSEFSITVVEDTLVAVGGTITLRRCASLLGLKEKSGSMEWKKVLPDMPTARAFPSCCVSSSNLLVVSGGEVSGDSSLRVEVLDLEKKRWEIVGSLPFNLGSCTRMFSCAANSDDIFYLGGFDDGSLTNTVFKTNAKALLSGPHHSTMSTSLWQTVQELPVAGSSGVMVHGQLLSIGGFNKKSRSYSKIVRTYDFVSNSWKEVSSMAREFSRGMAAVVTGPDGKEKLVVVGGSTSKGVSCTVSVASLDT